MCTVYVLHYPLFPPLNRKNWEQAEVHGRNRLCGGDVVKSFVMNNAHLLRRA